MSDDIYRHIGRRVREERNHREWTQEQLAERAGLTLSFVGQIERGIKKPSIATLKRLATAFNISAGAILEEAPQKRKPDALERRLASILRMGSHKQQEFLFQTIRYLTDRIRKFPRT